ncbi:MAG TPA: S9 family peptidase [Pseudonocardiaceae bacterium]|jgi:dipeptidyl aminopeptidase/acylaminoacyl peptidase
MNPESIAELRLVGNPDLHPDGLSIVASVQTVAPDRRAYRNQLFRFTEDGTSTPLTDDTGSDTAPAHSPDGSRIAYLSQRDGVRQVRLADGDLPHPPGQATAFVWLDDATIVAVVELPDVAPAVGEPVTIEWLRYKRDGEAGFIEPIHDLFVLTPGQDPRPLPRPDGRVSCLTAGHGVVVYVLDARHSDEPTPPSEIHELDPATGTDRLLWTSPSKVSGLAVTDRSGLVVAVASGQPGESATPPTLWLLGDGSASRAFPLADLEVERAVLGDSRAQGTARVVQPVAGSDEVVLLATNDEDAALYRGNPADSAPRRVTPKGVSVSYFSATRNGRTAVCLESPTTPVELTFLDTPKPVTSLNADWDAVAPETVRLGDMHALLYRAEPTPGPLIIRVHGGPHLCWGSAFDLETQLYVRAGYRVLMPNIGGSAGRGTEFRRRVVGEWGRTDYAELMAFADWAVEHGIADPARMYLAGGSYGGYLINWTLTRTDRFRAVVSERSVSSLVSKLGTSDNGYTANRFEMGGADLFDDGIDTLIERSPLHHADAITTPMLLLHGENDYRCPIEQSEQLFVALRRHGREAKFVRFPGGAHSWAVVGRPDHRITRLRMILEWFDAHR